MALPPSAVNAFGALIHENVLKSVLSTPPAGLRAAVYIYHYNSSEEKLQYLFPLSGRKHGINPQQVARGAVFLLSDHSNRVQEPR